MTKKLYLFLFLFTSILLVGIYITSKLFNDFWISQLSYLGVMILAGLTLIGLEKGKLPNKEKQTLGIIQVVGTAIGTIGLITVTSFLVVLVAKLGGFQLTGFSNTTEVNRVFIVVIYLSVFEEILFRRILAQKISNVLGIKKGIWISALIFAIVHIYSGTGLLNVFIAGVILAYIYLKTNSIYLSILAHLFFNLTIIFLRPVFAAHFDKINNYWIIVTTILIGLGLIYGMIKILNKKPAGNTGLAIKP